MIKTSLWAQHWSPKVFFFSSISALNIYSDIVCFMCVHVFLICWTSYFILKCDVGQHEAGGLEMENHYGHH